MEERIQFGARSAHLFREAEQNVSVIGLSASSKGKAVPLQAWTGPEGSRKLRFPYYVTTAQDGCRLSALCTGRLYPQEIPLVLISVVGTVAQSVYRLTTGWTVRDRIPVGTRSSASSDRPWGPPSLL